MPMSKGGEKKKQNKRKAARKAKNQAYEERVAKKSKRAHRKE